MRGWPEHFTVHVPSLPGFGRSARPDWIAGVRDLAAWVTWFVRDLKLAQPLPVIGFSLGGWIAAEIATVNASIFTKLVLVGAAGLQPEDRPGLGLLRPLQPGGVRPGVLRPGAGRRSTRSTTARPGRRTDEAQAEQNREMAARLLWKPYMRSHTLAGLLPGVATPTLVVWGREDAIIPLERGRALSCGRSPGRRRRFWTGAATCPRWSSPTRSCRWCWISWRPAPDRGA